MGSDIAWGILTRDGNLHMPVGGVTLVEDAATGVLLQAEWETVDDRSQPDGSRHRWRNVVPTSAIERIVYDLGTVDGAEG